MDITVLVAPPQDCRSQGELQGRLLGCFTSLKEKELGVDMLSIYHLWLARNDALNEPMIEDPDMTSQRVLAMLDEWSSMKTASHCQELKDVEH